MRTILFTGLLLAIACGAPNQESNVSQTVQELKITPENHDQVMAEMFPAPTCDIHRIGILVYDGVNSLDVFGPRYVLAQMMGVQVDLIAPDSGLVKTVMGIDFLATTTMEEVDSLDILLIPGGFQGTIAATKDERILSWIREMDQYTSFTAAVCTGGHILGASGLLKGKQATTNWYRAEEFLHKYEAEFTGTRWARDGKYWTSAGVTAGMDMALALLAECYGEKYAQGVMLDMEYAPDPPFPGGSPATTPPDVYQMMEAMYDMGFEATENMLNE